MDSVSECLLILSVWERTKRAFIFLSLILFLFLYRSVFFFCVLKFLDQSESRELGLLLWLFCTDEDPEKPDAFLLFLSLRSPPHQPVTTGVGATRRRRRTKSWRSSVELRSLSSVWSSTPTEQRLRWSLRWRWGTQAAAAQQARTFGKRKTLLFIFIYFF